MNYFLNRKMNFILCIESSQAKSYGRMGHFCISPDRFNYMGWFQIGTAAG